MTTAPMPPRLGKAKAAAVTVAAMGVTAALTFGATTMASEALLSPRNATAAVSAPLTKEQAVDLLASIGIYPIGPGAQIARLLGAGTPQDALKTMGLIAGLIPGETGTNLQASLQTIAAALEAAQDGLEVLPSLTLAFPEIKVPQFGPAGTYDAVAGLEGDVSTRLLLTLLKSGPDFIKVPLNVPVESFLGLPFSSATKLAILPTFGLGGTNTAFVAPYFLKEGEFADTAVLAIPIRNTSRPGGGIVALLNPLSSLVGVNLANVDGREGNGNGNVTFWDVTAAYDILSDAPSTVFNPVAWANAATGALMPTYLVPQNVEAFAGVIEDVVSGNISLQTITALLASGDIATLFHTESGEDGNLYITYDSGNLPLLEPFQFLPRTISYLPGFDISTPVSESFNDVLTQLVAMGYQDVVLDGGDPGQVPSFVRGWDQAGTQAEFWTSPVSFEDGLQVPQALFNALIGDGDTTGLTGNLLNPEAQDLTLFGSSAIGDAVYRNAVSVAVAGFLRDALLELKKQLNPIFDAVDSNGAVVSIAKGLDDAVDEINGVIGQGGDAIKGQGINLSDPIMDANRGLNNLVGGTTVPDLAKGASDLDKSTAPEVNVSTQDAIKAGPDVKKQGDEDNEATSIAGSLKQQRETLRAGVEKRKTELENRLTRRADDAKRVTDKLRSGDIGGAAEEAGKNVQQRVERVGKDIENGVKKVTGRHRKDTKATAAA